MKRYPLARHIAGPDYYEVFRCLDAGASLAETAQRVGWPKTTLVSRLTRLEARASGMIRRWRYWGRDEQNRRNWLWSRYRLIVQRDAGLYYFHLFTFAGPGRKWGYEFHSPSLAGVFIEASRTIAMHETRFPAPLTWAGCGTEGQVLLRYHGVLDVEAWQLATGEWEAYWWQGREEIKVRAPTIQGLPAAIARAWRE